jgi:hypothetical protein
VNRKYDLFERMPDDSTIWKDVAQGLESARVTLSRLAERSPNEFFAIHIPTNEIVAQANVRAPKKPEDTNEDLLINEPPTEEEIAARALELYENRRENGRDDGKAAIDDWLDAKRQLREERQKGAKS